MKLKFVLIFIFLLLAPKLFASNKIIWTWHEYDSKVTWYRYQINNFEDLDIAWKYLPNIPSKRCIVIDVDPNISEYILYIQSSYDGVSWSEPARSIVDTSAYNYVDLN